MAVETLPAAGTLVTTVAGAPAMVVDLSIGTLPTIGIIVLLGIGAQLLARRVEVPSVLFLIVIGLVLGWARVVTVGTFGDGLSTIVGFSVAIIVFDGAFQLRVSRVREASRTTLRLTTIGSLLTFTGITLAVHLFLGVSWALSALVGILLVATGPTVVTPILEVVPVREHVASAMETEAIIKHVTSVIGAVVIYETLVVGDGTVLDGVVGFLGRLGGGIGTGVVVAGLIYVALNRDLTPGAAPQAARFLFLAGAIGAFVTAELVAAEAGIAAAATAGFLLGNADLSYRETMVDFGRDLTLLVLSFLFISLTALVDFADIRAVGAGGLAVVFVVVLVIRPLVVAISTAGIERFTPSERLFLGAVGPRGLGPASVATLFAIELATGGNPETAQILVGPVFLVILVTIVLEAGLARQIASFLSVIPMRTLIVGGGRIGRALATRLENRGEYVIIVEKDDRQIERVRNEGLTVHAGDGTESDVLRAAGAEDAKILIAVTNDDDQNLLACQIASSKFGIDHRYARVNQPDNMSAFDSMGVTAIDSSMATVRAIDNEIERPAIAHWMNEIGEDHDVQEIEVTAENLVGRTIRDFNADIPDGCIVAVIGREGETHVPSADEELQRGDSITFIGDEVAVARAIKRFHPHD